MTTIVWDGRYLAADQKHEAGDTAHYMACKIVAANRAFYSQTGPCAWMDAWIAWDAAGADPHAVLPKNTLEGYQGGLIRLRNGTCDMLDYRIPYWTTAARRWAWGSGADFALAAMACGKHAMASVEIASQFDPHTGGGIDFFDALNPSAVILTWRGEGV